MIARDLPTFVHIPSQPFLMGSPESALSQLARLYGGTRESYREEAPQHSVTLPAFAIAEVPVTNRLFAAFAAATALPLRPPLHDPALALHPVVDVTWDAAQQFCAWLNTVASTTALAVRDPVGGATAEQRGPWVFRLPSEAEWEHAARGSDGRTFPWGAEFTPTLANTREAERAGTSAVGAYPAGASPYGVLDMAGNVWEWTATLDGLYPYRSDDGRENPLPRQRRILRGGCYANPHGFARCACRFRLLPTVSNAFIGFRLAVSL